MMYIPPFTISSLTINRIAEISALIECYAIRLENEEGLRLRRINRIKTIHSSLAIEGNTLSEGQIEDIINGKHVIAPIREIQEVKNAIKTYELFSSLNPFDIDDLLKAHGTMMEALIDSAGKFRKGGVGVVGEQGIIHVAPSAEMVPTLMKNLFRWLSASSDHLLIRSCVFHYELEFIHPFNDGNGRIGRLWQSLILGQLHPLFEHLPVENIVFADQANYYEAIAESSRQGQSGPFIEYMLDKILETLKSHQGEEISLHDVTWRVLDVIKSNPHASSSQIGVQLGLGERMIRNHIALLKSHGLITRVGSNKTGYWKVCNH